jgi:putative membrane protein
MRKTAILATVAGLALFIFLIAREGTADILAALAAAGWSLIWVALFHFIPLSLDTVGWMHLVSRRDRPPFRIFCWARWVAEAFNSLLPVAQIGGHVVRAILIAGRRLPKTQASATVMVDFTVGIATQFVFSFLGAALLLGVLKSGSWVADVAGIVILAFGFLILFFLAQRHGFFSLTMNFAKRILGDGRKVLLLTGNARALDDQIALLYRQHRTLAACGAFRLAGWLLKAAETLLALHLLGYRAGFGEALIIESLSNAVASAAFVIPGGLGVREGGILLLGGLLGLPPEGALALALVRRGRELVLGFPGLLVWLASEGPGLLKKSNKGLAAPQLDRNDGH